MWTPGLVVGGYIGGSVTAGTCALEKAKNCAVHLIYNRDVDLKSSLMKFIFISE